MCVSCCLTKNIEWRVKVGRERERERGYSGDGAKEEGGYGRSLIGKRREEAAAFRCQKSEMRGGDE